MDKVEDSTVIYYVGLYLAAVFGLALIYRVVDNYFYPNQRKDLGLDSIIF
jgi:hypothetical protein